MNNCCHWVTKQGGGLPKAPVLISDQPSKHTAQLPGVTATSPTPEAHVWWVYPVIRHIKCMNAWCQSLFQWTKCVRALGRLTGCLPSFLHPAAPLWRPGTSSTTPSALCVTTAASTSNRGATSSLRTICTVRPTPRHVYSPPRATTLWPFTPTPRWR